MRWQNREGSQNVEDRRGSGSGSDGGGKTPGLLGLIVVGGRVFSAAWHGLSNAENGAV
ncbi:neutral zinc metallopeptidase [Kingella kingae]|uniref:neutral zinc metallopeptidase n=1 Tax=Kingella kingae TaxID=504 RepID=UPI000407BA61|nr:neutral zinc metallopeptidase [Kingella kingae]MDK4607618.1 neutral zinc metallopeptidase [Kingella kingae]MDK4625147.1 neutral zinc metallopeptidase [Kingella kingae]MDK4687594.1 neutral zinc metallopeptidase [Kingella kingae]